MDKERIHELIEFMKYKLRESGITSPEVMLFGSRNGGTAKEDSDVDMIIISTAFENKDVFERSELVTSSKLAVIRNFLVPLDIIFLTPREFEEDPTYAAMIANA